MVALLCLTSVDMRFDGCRGEDGPTGEGNSDSLMMHIYTQQRKLVFFVGDF